MVCESNCLKLKLSWPPSRLLQACGHNLGHAAQISHKCLNWLLLFGHGEDCLSAMWAHMPSNALSANLCHVPWKRWMLCWQCLCLCRCDSVSVMTCCCHADQTLCSAWLYNLLCLEKLPASKETWRRWSWRCSFTGNHTLGVPNLTTWDLTWPYCMWHCSDSNKKKGSQAGGAFYAWKSIKPSGIEFGNLEGLKSTKIGHVQKMDPRTPLDLFESSKE